MNQELGTTLQYYPKYPAASEFVESLLEGKINKSAMKEVWNSSANDVYDIVAKTFDFENNINSNTRVRKVEKPKKMHILEAKNRLKKNEAYKNVQKKLILWKKDNSETHKVLTQEELRPLFTKYASDIQKIYTIGLESGLTRGNNKSIVTHWNRVSGVSGELSKNEKKYFDATKAAKHDFTEEFYPLLTMRNGQRYALKNEKLFFDNYFPKELHGPLRELTNYYGLIISYAMENAKKQGNKTFTQQFFINYINQSLRSPKLTNQMRFSLEEFKKILPHIQPDIDLKKEDLRMLAYGLYLDNMKHEYVTKIIDRDDNNEDDDSKDAFRTSNFNKTSYLVEHAKKEINVRKENYSILKEISNKEILKNQKEETTFLYELVNELEYNMVKRAKNMSIYYMFKEVSEIDFTGQIMEYMNSLKNVFYEKINQ